MATLTKHIDASPERVFEVLSDPSSYAHWVVGARKVRDASPRFPAPGTKFHHQQGFPPLRLNDETEVLEADPPWRLVLQARFRPFGTQRVTLEMARDGDRTRVTMTEEPGDLFTRMLFNPLADLLLRGRNEEALRRLGNLATASPSA